MDNEPEFEQLAATWTGMNPQTRQALAGFDRDSHIEWVPSLIKPPMKMSFGNASTAGIGNLRAIFWLSGRGDDFGNKVRHGHANICSSSIVSWKKDEASFTSQGDVMVRKRR
jgi:hypothetical protein